MSDKVAKRKSLIINVLFFAMLAALIYFAVKYALGWLMPFLIGFLVALLIKPVMQFLNRKIRLPLKVSAIVLVLLFYAIVSFLLFLLASKIALMMIAGFSQLPQAYSEYVAPAINNLIVQFNDMIARLDPQITQVFKDLNVSFTDSISSTVSNVSTKVVNFLTNTVISVPGIILFILLSIISSIFFALDYRKIVGYLTAMLPNRVQSKMSTLRCMAVDISGKYIKSYSIILSVTFIELALGMLILGVNNAIIIAALIAFVDILPVLGTGAVLLPWALVSMLINNYTMAIGLIVLYVVIIVVRNILEPRIIGKQIGVHPLAMLAGMYVGLQIFGVVGIFVMPIVLLIVKGYVERRNAAASKMDGADDEALPFPVGDTERCESKTQKDD